MRWLVTKIPSFVVVVGTGMFIIVFTKPAIGRCLEPAATVMPSQVAPKIYFNIILLSSVC